LQFGLDLVADGDREVENTVAAVVWVSVDRSAPPNWCELTDAPATLRPVAAVTVPTDDGRRLSVRGRADVRRTRATRSPTIMEPFRGDNEGVGMKKERDESKEVRK